jgi:hypothetical protein
MMVSFFVLVVLVVVVDNKHNSSKLSFQVMENEIVREETIWWNTPTSKLIMWKAPILGSEAKERGRNDTENCVSTRRVMEMTLSEGKQASWSYQADIFRRKAGFVIVSGWYNRLYRDRLLVYCRTGIWAGSTSGICRDARIDPVEKGYDIVVVRWQWSYLYILYI